MKSKWLWYWWLLPPAAVAAALVRHFVCILVPLFLTVRIVAHNPKTQARMWARGIGNQLLQVPATPQNPGMPSAALLGGLTTNSASLEAAGELFRTTNVWDVHLLFTVKQWADMKPESVPPLLNFMGSDGTPVLRNPAASRSGLAGILGIDLPWSHANFRFGNLTFTNVGARFKGNGTFVGSIRSYKRPFKIELNKQVQSEQLAGRTTINLHNLTADRTCLCDTLACEFFREAGVPAPRTAFARLRLSIESTFDDRLLGLYVMVENPDGQWAREQFGTKGVVLFKPVTLQLFADLGDDWTAYAPIYDPKTKTTNPQQRRLIDLAKLVTQPDDAKFAARIGDFIELTEFARFLACQVILANYDSILSNGQNFLIYLDPRTDRFGFIPWDHDHCWGQFPLIGTADDRARASIWHPWVGENRFLARMLAVPAFRQVYESELKRLLDTQFVPERLSRRVDELATVIRPFVEEESSQRLFALERGIAARTGANQTGFPDRSGLPLKDFFAVRAASVSDQLAGRSEGVVLERRPVR